MEEKKFEEMLDTWASQEMDAAPKMRPTKEIYARVNAKKRKLFFPVFVRWATVATAAATILLVVVLQYPGIFRPSKPLDQVTEREELVGELQQAESPKPAAPVVSSAKMDEFEPGKPEIELTSSLPAEPMAGRDRKAEMSPLFDEKKETISEKPVLPASTDLSETIADQAAPPAPTEVMAKTRAVSESFKLKAAPTAIAPSPVAKDEFDAEFGYASGQSMAPKTLALSEESADTKDVGSKVFHLEDGVWVDAEHSQAKQTITIKRDSQAYLDLVAARPEWKVYFEISPNVIVNLGEYSVAIADEGNTELAADELERLMKE